MSCRRYESSVEGLEPPSKLVDFVPRSTGCAVGASRVIVCRSGAIESMETIETELALDKAAEARGSMPLQETIRRAIEGMCGH